MGKIGTYASPRAPGFRDVLRERTFVVPYLAEMQSIAGDQLARVALSVLVYDQTGSSPATAATYAATLLPALLGGLWLGGLGDRFPRKWVMVVIDLVRAACFVAMAVGSTPLLAIVGLLVVAVFLGPAFSSSEVSYLAANLAPERFRVGNALRLVTIQAAQVVGFAVGGALVVALHPRNALLVNSATFVLSALLVGLFVPAGRSGAQRADGVSEADPSAKGATEDPPFPGLWRHRRLRSLVLLCALIGFFMVPEGLAVPFGRSVGASTGRIGLLLAAGAIGGAVGAALLVRSRPADRAGRANRMAVGCGVPLVVSGLAPSWPLAMACWLISGGLAAYLVETMTEVVQAIPDSSRARLVGTLGSIILGAQGVGMVLFGAASGVVSVGHAIGAAGLLGTVGALVLVLGPLRASDEPRADPRTDALTG